MAELRFRRAVATTTGRDREPQERRGQGSQSPANYPQSTTIVNTTSSPRM